MMNKIFIGLLLCPAVYLHGAEPADSTLRLMEEITVAANRQQDVKMNVPQQVYILSRAQIERANAQTAADLLTTDGLLTVQKSQQGGGSPMIRGFESSRVLLVMDNVKMNNLIYRAGHLQNHNRGPFHTGTCGSALRSFFGQLRFGCLGGSCGFSF